MDGESFSLGPMDRASLVHTGRRIMVEKVEKLSFELYSRFSGDAISWLLIRGSQLVVLCQVGLDLLFPAAALSTFRLKKLQMSLRLFRISPL